MAVGRSRPHPARGGIEVQVAKANIQRRRGVVESGRGSGHPSRRMVARRPKKDGPGRPAAEDPRVKNYSFRVKKAYEKAIEDLAKQERRTAPELMRIIIGDHLIAKKLLPPDYEF